MAWIPIGAWIFAALVTIVVLGYCAYEIGWKANRLRADLAAVQADANRLAVLRAHLVQAQERATGRADASGPG
ncbi:MAG TPA: hypothetical protein VFU35_07035 [Jatrophihabitans sp.]|nr:hypothetical protein [Jatrophihabitans sp.]